MAKSGTRETRTARVRDLGSVSSPVVCVKLGKVTQSNTNISLEVYLMAILDNYMSRSLLAIFRLSSRELKVLLYILRSFVVQRFIHRALLLNPLTLNDSYSGRTTPLTSKRSILYIYSTNIGTEYFKHVIYSPFLSLQNAVCFIILTYLVPVLFTFYIFIQQI